MTWLPVAAAATAIAGLAWLLRGYQAALRACLFLNLAGILGGFATGRAWAAASGVACGAVTVYALAVTRP